jgi:plasmid stabilization system protein ParE
MNRPVILTRLARAEFDEAADWYESRKRGLGPAFTTAVREVLVSLGSRPESHPIVRDDVREALVSRYPYAVYYRLSPDRVTVLAIFHTSRDPSEWLRRL